MESNDRLLKSPAPSTSYFSLTIWKTGTAPSTSPYNAGNNDPEVGSHILRFLQVYWQRLPEGGVKTTLHKRWEFIQRAVWKMNRYAISNNWWDSYRPNLNLPSGSDNTTGANDST